MAHALSSRLGRLGTIVASGLGLGGLGLCWSLVRPAPWLLAATLLCSYFFGWGAALVLARPPRTRMVARFTLMTLALAVTLGILEGLSAVGLADFRQTLATEEPVPGHFAFNTTDPELISIHKPYLKRRGATRGDLASALHLTGTPLHPFDVAYDRHGFRNARDLTSAEIVVLGDSFVEGGLVPAERLVTATLGRLLGCTVANLGQSGYGPQQELAVLRRYAAPLHPRLCIWMFYEGNDLDDVKHYPQLTQDAGRALRRSTPWERSFGRNALRALARALEPILAPDAADAAPWGEFRDADGRTTRLYFRDRGAPHSCGELAALNDVVSVLTAAHAACAANRMPLLVVFAPEKFRVYKDACTFRPDNPCARWVLDDLPERLRARVAAIDPGIGFLDLTPALTAEAKRGRLLYFVDDTHWSVEGHQVAGQAVAAYLTQRGDRGPQPQGHPDREDRLTLKSDELPRR
jgi:hypothetical protein